MRTLACGMPGWEPGPAGMIAAWVAFLLVVFSIQQTLFKCYELSCTVRFGG